MPPGSSVYVGDQSPREMKLSVIAYDAASVEQSAPAGIEELLSGRKPGGVTWIRVCGLGGGERLPELCAALGVHPLTTEDILDTEHRPKIEEFDEYLYFSFKEIQARPQVQSGDEGGALELDFQQISLILTRTTVISIEENPVGAFDNIARNIEHNIGRIRRMGADYLAYGLMNFVVDGYFQALDEIGQKISEFEDRAMDEGDTALIPDLQGSKQRLLSLRRAVWPFRESLASITRQESPLFSAALDPFLKDLHDNLLQAAETIESYRELLSEVLEVNMSAVSNRMNKVMKVLTIISTIFIPITFIVGVYGMNFAYMPELGHRYGYPIVMGLMLLIALGMIAFFKKKKWM
jgi:magnesium transporter